LLGGLGKHTLAHSSSKNNKCKGPEAIIWYVSGAARRPRWLNKEHEEMGEGRR